MKTLKAAGALVLVALVLPASAWAHPSHVSINVTCTAATFTWSDFPTGDTPVSFTVTADDKVVAQDTFTASGTSGTTSVPLALTGSPSVQVNLTWTTSTGTNTQTGTPHVVVCETPPAPPPATTTSTPPPVVTPAPITTPTNTVRGTQVRAPTAALRMSKQCGEKTVRVTVAGRSMRRITFSVAGRKVRSVAVRVGRRTVTVRVPLRSFGPRRQTVKARVSFRNGTARTLTASAARCAQGAVSPQFTG